jgi:serine/threonine protein kinase
MNDTARNSREGSQFGRYYLKRLLGHGGMGDVYEAEDTVEQRIVALKVLPPVFSHDLVFTARLQRVARIVGELEEPHIVAIHDYGEIDGQQFLEMRLIEGTDLSKLLKRVGALSAPRAVAIVRQIASALDAAHAVGVIHGDVKPENILIARDDFAYLVDLGITEAAPHKGVARVVGSAVGTWKYTAPERFTVPVANHKVDIYALTCVLHECLTGSPPYWADSAGALISAHLLEPTPRPSQLQPAISSAFDEVIARGMAKDPLERYASAGELALAAYEALSAPDQDRMAGILKPSQEATRPDAESELTSAPAASSAPSVPTSHPSADPPYHEPSVSESLPKPSPPAESTQTPGAVPRFGLGDSGGLGELGVPPPEPTPSRATPRKERPRLVLGGAAVIALVVLSGVAIWLLRPWHPTPALPETNSTESAESTPTPPAAETQARLFSLLPRGYPPGACKPITLANDALATVSCDKNADQDGPPSAMYVLFPNATSLRGAFNRIVQGTNIIDCPGRIQSPGPWHRVATPDQASGMLLCGSQQGHSMVAWTNDAELLLSVINAEPPGPPIDQLYSWWMSHS